MYISKNDRRIKILTYHRIVEGNAKGELSKFCVRIDDFRSQMKILEVLNFTPITFLDYKLYLEDKLTLPKNPIIITFDDGYLDTFELAIPTLLEFDMRAVIFVLGNRALKTADWTEGDDAPLMNNEQVVTARSLGFEIGSHSMDHDVLTELSEFELRDNILQSKRSIESVLGERIYSFAYPYGFTNERVIRITSESGYVFGCGVYSGPPDFGKNFYDFRRFIIKKHTGILQFLLYLLTPFQYVEWMHSKLKRKLSKPIKVNKQKGVNKKTSLFEQSIHE